MSSYRVYVVDWDHNGHPTIREHAELPYETPPSELLTLAQAKAEVIAYHKMIITEARAAIVHTRAIRVRDIPQR